MTFTMEAMSKLLDEKLDEKLDLKLKPISVQLNGISSSLENAHAEISNLKQRVEHLESKQKALVKETTAKTREINQLKDDQKKLKDHVLSLEYQSRRDNLQIVGIEEQKGEDIEKTVLKIVTDAGIDMEARQIIRAHRLGNFNRKSTRPVLVKFAHFKDREVVWKMRSDISLQNNQNIKIFEDWPKEMADRRKILFPILNEARKATDGNGIPLYKAAIRQDKLYLNGEIITTETLHKLPKHLHPENIFTPSRGNIVAFFTSNSPLSNHYISPFEMSGRIFNSTEQYVMFNKAIMFGDTAVAEQIMKEPNPGIQKGLGMKVANFDKSRWHAAHEKIFINGLRAKFTQDKHCADFLLATGDKKLVEGSPKDKDYGVGLSIFSEKIWNEANYEGLNWMGHWLELIRGELRRR